MNRNHKRRRPIAEINVVPYIDVMLVLLVIFMVTAPLLTQGIDVQLPQAPAESVDGKEGKLLVLTVKEDGSYHVNLDGALQQRLDLEAAIARAVAAIKRDPGIPVHIAADRRVPFDKVVQLIAALKEEDVEQVGLLVDPLEEGP